jgi:hypothetical protein
VVDTVTTDANNVSNSTTDAAAVSAGYANFYTTRAHGYADSDVLKQSDLQARSANWSNLYAADAASTVMGFRNYRERMAADTRAVSTRSGSIGIPFAGSL